jgi:hypothetical protein
VGGAVGRWHAVTVEFLPLSEIVVKEEGIPGDNVLAWMTKGVPVSPTAPPKRMALSLLMGVIVWPNRADGLSPVNYAFSIINQLLCSNDTKIINISYQILHTSNPKRTIKLGYLHTRSRS